MEANSHREVHLCDQPQNQEVELHQLARVTLTADGQPPANVLTADERHLHAKGYKARMAIVKPPTMILAAIDGVQRLDVPKDNPKPR